LKHTYSLKPVSSKLTRIAAFDKVSARFAKQSFSHDVKDWRLFRDKRLKASMQIQ